MTTQSPTDVASRLTRAQRSTIAGLDRDFCVMGCGEATAKDLSEARISRPALVQRRRGARYQEFALTDFGMAVKEAL